MRLPSVGPHSFQHSGLLPLSVSAGAWAPEDEQRSAAVLGEVLLAELGRLGHVVVLGGSNPPHGAEADCELDLHVRLSRNGQRLLAVASLQNVAGQVVWAERFDVAEAEALSSTRGLQALTSGHVSGRNGGRSTESIA